MRYNQADKSFKNDWLSFYPKLESFYLVYNVAGYFEGKPYIHCSLSQIFSLLLLPVLGFHWYSLLLIVPFFVSWGVLYITLPFKTHYDECEPPRYGIYYMHAGIWICHGRKTKCFHLPYEYTWVRTSILLKDGNWEHETIGNTKNFYKDKWDSVRWSEEHPYTYVLNNGKIQHRIATIKVEEREWRQRWLKWTSLFAEKSKDIAVDFSYGGPIQREILVEKQVTKERNREYTGEVGERTGSWKGGTTGCGYEMLPNETPLETLRRMEKERKF